MPSGLTYFYDIETYYAFIFIVSTFVAKPYSYHFILVSYMCDRIICAVMYQIYMYLFMYEIETCL